MTQTTFGGDDAQLSDEGPARPGVRAPFTQKPSRAALSTQDLEAEDADGPGLSPPQAAGFSFAPSDAEHEEDSADDDMPVEKKGIEAKVEVEIEKEGSNNGMDVEEDQSILPSHEEVEDEGAGAGVPDSSDMLGKEAQESGKYSKCHHIWFSSLPVDIRFDEDRHAGSYPLQYRCHPLRCHKATIRQNSTYYRFHLVARI